jgi:oligopeptide transport system permease protein
MSSGSSPDRRSQRPPRWQEHALSIPLNLSWAVWLLYLAILLPMREAGLGPWLAGAVWATLNLFVTIHIRAALKRQATVSSRGPSPGSSAPPPSTAVGADDLVAGTSLLRDALRRLRLNQLATLCLGLLLLVGTACFAHRLIYEVGRANGADSEFFAYHLDHTRTDKEAAFAAPNTTHWFGTDALGRDVFARTMYGGSISFLVAIVATVVSLVIGITWGSVAGYLGGRTDHYMMRIVDVLYGLPFMFLVILIMSLVNGLHVTASSVRPHVEAVAQLQGIGDAAAALAYATEHSVDFNARAAVFLDENVPPIVVMFFALGMVEWLTMARIVRGQVLSLREREFVAAARLMGASTPRILFRHIVPNLLGPVVVYTTLTVPTVMLLEAFLSFLGLGISEPDCSWGSLASDGIGAINMIKPYWWLLAYPAAAISLALFSLNFVGDGLRDALDPRGRR